ncbi:MAG: hypothetical protein HOI22_10800 [Tateyamaria sp.]|nr:hypothetical protein [Tateyamaria sp.]
MFIHIPKTGGSSLEHDLVSQGWREEFSVHGIPADQLRFARASPQHFHADLLERVFRFEAFDKVVALVREPYTRLKSEYYWHFRNTEAKPDPALWLDDVFQKLADDPFLNDNHFRHQAEFLPSGVDVSVFKLEEDGVALARRTICGPDLPQRSLRDRLLRRRSKHSKTSTYQPEVERAFQTLRPKIVGFYRKDYDVFGYDPAPYRNLPLYRTSLKIT